MKTKGLVALVLTFGFGLGALISPLIAQQQSASQSQPTCMVGEYSNAACSGDWIYFAGNTSAVDNGAWLIGVNGNTGEVWVKDGRRLNPVEKRD